MTQQYTPWYAGQSDTSVNVVASSGVSTSSSWFSDFKMPEINPAVSPILSTFGAINSAIGSYYQAQAQKNNLQFQADMAKINAQIAEGNAQATMLAGQRQAQNVMLRGAQMKSAQKVGFAANGVDLGSRSALNILTTTDYMTETDRNTIEANAIRAAWGYRTQAINERNTSVLASTAADQISPVGNGLSSLLSSSGRVADSWYKYSKRD